MSDSEIDAEMAVLFEADFCEQTVNERGAVVRAYENRRGQRILVEVDRERRPTVYTFHKNLLP